MTANDILKKLESPDLISEEYFNQLITDFQNSYLKEKSYYERAELHRNPIEVKNGMLRDLSDYSLKIQYRDEMRDSEYEKNTQGYVPANIQDVWKSDKRLKTLYNAIEKYCLLLAKDFNVIAVHVAEYEAITKLYSTISRSINEDNSTKQLNKMPKNFEIERRETFEKPYLKIFLRGGLDNESVAKHLETLYSVHRANVTDQKSGKRDITVYPEKAYDITEVEQEIELTLTNYFKGNPVDPSFVTETISAISDKAYFQILSYIIRLGKELEKFKELNTKFDEERYRDYFIPFLNAISPQHAAKAEVFNCNS